MRALIFASALVLASLPGWSVAEISAIGQADELAKNGKIEEAYSLLRQFIIEKDEPIREHIAISKMAELSRTYPNDASVIFVNAAQDLHLYLNENNAAYLQLLLSRALSDIGDYGNANHTLRNAIAKYANAEDHWGLQYQLGLNFYIQGDLEGAERQLDRVATLPTDSQVEQLALGVQRISLYQRLGKWGEVIKMGESVKDQLSGDPRQLGVLDQTANAYYQIGDLDSACRAYEEFIDLYEKRHPNPNPLEQGRLGTARDRLEDIRINKASRDRLLTSIGSEVLADLAKTPPASLPANVSSEASPLPPVKAKTTSEVKTASSERDSIPHASSEPAAPSHVLIAFLLFGILILGGAALVTIRLK